LAVVALPSSFSATAVENSDLLPPMIGGGGRGFGGGGRGFGDRGGGGGGDSDYFFT
jgi:hypothetical protein